MTSCISLELYNMLERSKIEHNHGNCIDQWEIQFCYPFAARP
jgi:hypothetical protein